MSLRLFDVFLTGPLQIYVGAHVNDNLILRVCMVGCGVMTILYNLHNAMYIDTRLLRSNYFGSFTNPRNGKTQLHRMYNLIVMYPIFYYVYKTYPTKVSVLFLLEIVVGFLFNLYNFIKLS